MAERMKLRIRGVGKWVISPPNTYSLTNLIYKGPVTQSASMDLKFHQDILLYMYIYGRNPTPLNYCINSSLPT